MEDLDLKFLEEDSILLESLFELGDRDKSSLLRIESSHGTIDGPEIGEVIILVQCEFDLAVQPVHLRIEFDSKKGHSEDGYK